VSWIINCLKYTLFCDLCQRPPNTCSSLITADGHCPILIKFCDFFRYSCVHLPFDLTWPTYFLLIVRDYVYALCKPCNNARLLVFVLQFSKYTIAMFCEISDLSSVVIHRHLAYHSSQWQSRTLNLRWWSRHGVSEGGLSDLQPTNGCGVCGRAQPQLQNNFRHFIHGLSQTKKPYTCIIMLHSHIYLSVDCNLNEQNFGECEQNHIMYMLK